MSKVDEFMATIEEEITDREFSESRKVVARQNGNMRKMVERMCDESEGVETQANLFLAIHAAIDIITAIDEETIEHVATTLRKMRFLPDKLPRPTILHCRDEPSTLSGARTMQTALFAFQLDSPYKFARIVVVRSTKDDALHDARNVMHSVLNGNRAFGATKLASTKPVVIPEQDKAAWDAPKQARCNGEQIGWITNDVRWM